MRWRAVMLILCVLICGNAFGESITPPLIDELITVPSTLKTDPIQQIHLGGLTAEFEKTTLVEIRNAIGYGVIDHAGDAGESQYWLCYSLKGQRIWLISNGEMGGSNHMLTRVAAVSTASTTGSCPPMPAFLQPVSFLFGRIGASKKSLLDVLGAPSGISNDKLIYQYAGKKPQQYKGGMEEFDVTAHIEVKIENDRITSLDASHITSY
jgi:hypothetical protein